MQALTYSIEPWRWAACFLAKRVWPGCLLSEFGGLKLAKLMLPELPGDDWVLVKTMIGGICGSDVALVAQAHPPNSILQAYSSQPMILGHEGLGLVDQVGPAVDPAWIGKRVCVEPTLCCKVRGIDPPCGPCQKGRFGACENFDGLGGGSASLPAGTSTGYNSRTGGTCGEFFVAHESQLVAVPDGVSDELASLTDPVACSVHAALRADLSSAKKVLIYGAGVLGLGLIAALRAFGFKGRIEALDRSEYKMDLAGKFGADDFFTLPVAKAERFASIAKRTSGRAHEVRFSGAMLTGGYDVVFDCVGSGQSVDESLKWTGSGGQVILVGTGSGAWDITPVWFTELDVRGAYGRSVETYHGREITSYELVLELMAEGKLPVEAMLTHRFELAEYRKAYSVAMNKAWNRAIKVVFDLRK